MDPVFQEEDGQGTDATSADKIGVSEEASADKSAAADEDAEPVDQFAATSQSARASRIRDAKPGERPDIVVSHIREAGFVDPDTGVLRKTLLQCLELLYGPDTLTPYILRRLREDMERLVEPVPGTMMEKLRDPSDPADSSPASSAPEGATGGSRSALDELQRLIDEAKAEEEVALQQAQEALTDKVRAEDRHKAALATAERAAQRAEALAALAAQLEEGQNAVVALEALKARVSAALANE